MNFTNIDQFFKDSENLVKAFDIFAQKNNLVGKTKADHICYKCGSKESFEHIRSILENESEYIFQSIISKRRISYIKFKKGIETSLGTINFLELSDQKQDGSQVEGFDHIEVYPVTFSYDEMVSHLEKTEEVVKVERPHHTTHDIQLNDGFIFRCTRGALIEKIRDTEMI